MKLSSRNPEAGKKIYDAVNALLKTYRIPVLSKEIKFEHGRWWVKVITTKGDEEQRVFCVVDTNNGLDLEEV